MSRVTDEERENIDRGLTPGGRDPNEWPDDDAPRARKANGAAHNGERFHLHLWSDIGTPVPPDRLVHRLLGTSAFGAIVGAPGCGKSFLALALALAITNGTAFFGRRVTRGAVLYVSAEGHSGFCNRLLAHRDHHRLAGMVPLGWIEAAPNLGPGGEDSDHIITAVDHLKAATGADVVLIVIDTVNRSLGGGEENSSADMGAFVSACDRIRSATGATVLVVHHTGKDVNKGMRGHSSLLGACDTVITVDLITETKTRVATITKQKDGADGAAFTFHLEPVELGRDEYDEAITSCVVVPVEDEAANTGKKLKPKLSPADERCLDALVDALARHGQPGPVNDYVPRGVNVVSERTWRELADKAGFSASDKEDSKRRAFKRSADNLAAKGLVAKWADITWLCAR
jgi:hypothetical protein